MNEKLKAFKMNKNQMNRIGGGAIWRCSYNDFPENISNPCMGEMDFLDAPASWNADQMANYLQRQLGYPFSVSCRAISMNIHFEDPV